MESLLTAAHPGEEEGSLPLRSLIEVIMKRIVTALVAVGVGVIALASGTGDEGRMPDLDGAVAWLNSTPLSSKALRGKVVLVNFWTYSCINSVRELPYII